MTAEKEQEFLRRVREHLTQHEDGVDELTAARLQALRKQALEHRPRQGLRWFPAAGLATAAAAVLAVVVWQHHDSGLPLSADDWELLAAGEEIELIEEWEFYAWLEEQQANS